MNLASLPAPLASTPPVSTWHRAFQDLSREHGFEPLRVEGKLPPLLRGTLYRNGPARFAAQGQRYGHWFDGDGAISAVRFPGDGTGLGAARVVDTDALREERAAGRPLFAGYGTAAPGPWWRRLGGGRPKNVANISIITWQGRLFALWEGGLPTEVSAEDLSALGETDLGGVLLTTFSAHPHYIPARHAAYNFGVRVNGRPRLDLYELPDQGPARRLTTIPLAGATMIHDFIATDRHLIFFAPPLRLNIPRLLLGRGSYAENLRWRPEVGTEVLVVPIDRPEEVIRFETDPFYQWHFANAFETPRGPVVDLVRFPDFASNAYLGTLLKGGNGDVWDSQLVRAELDLGARRVRWETRSELSCEFPRVAGSVAGRPHRFVYLAAHPRRESSRKELFTHLVKVDLSEGTEQLVDLGEGRYPSEPIFVRRSAESEDDGWLLTLVYDAHVHASHVAVLDARRPGNGPVATVHFDHHIPFTFHGNFVRGDAR